MPGNTIPAPLSGARRKWGAIGAASGRAYCCTFTLGAPANTRGNPRQCAGRSLRSRGAWLELRHEMANSTVRRFCWTLNNYTELEVEEAKRFIDEKCKYGIFGKEVAPNTGCLHLQGFCNLKKPMRFSTIKSVSITESILRRQMDPTKKTKNTVQRQATFIERVRLTTKGEEQTWRPLYLPYRTEKSPHPKWSLNYMAPCISNTIVESKNTYTSCDQCNQGIFSLNCGCIGDHPDRGKSRRALEEATAWGESIYYKPRGLWWDGYEQQICVIIDDFYGWIKYDEILKICDRYPYKVQVKGAFQEFTSKYIWITSNCDTDDWYRFSGYSNAALERRITVKEYLS